MNRPAEGVRAGAELCAADRESESAGDETTDTEAQEELEQNPAPSRGVLFDGSFRKRLRARLDTETQDRDADSVLDAANQHRPPEPSPLDAETSKPETFSALSPPDESSQPEAEGQREGLPRGFRMRHSSHYVDEIATPKSGTPLRQVEIQRIQFRDPLPQEGLSALVDSIRELGLVQPLIVRPVNDGYELVAGSTRLAAASAAGLQAVPCVVQNVSEERARALILAARVKGEPAVASEPIPTAEPTAAAPLSTKALDEIERSLRAIVSSVEMMRSAPGPLLERAGRDLMTAEAHRCDWMVRATRYVHERPQPTPRFLNVTSTLERLAQLIEPESRLLSIDSSLEFGQDTPRTLQVQADETILSLGFEGIYRFLLATLAESRGGALTTRCDLSGGRIRIEFSQDQIPLSAERQESLFDPEVAESLGGFPSTVGLTCARLALEVHGGSLQAVTKQVPDRERASGFGLLATLPTQT